MRSHWMVTGLIAAALLLCPGVPDAKAAGMAPAALARQFEPLTQLAAQRHVQRPVHGGVHRPPVHGGGVHRPVPARPGPGYHPAHRPGYRPPHPGYRPGYRPPPPVYRPGYRPPAYRPGYYGGWNRPYRWAPGGAIAAGAAIGFVAAAAASAYASPPPAQGLCWYYTDPSRRNGFWDVCP